jgi:hypothetical protein
VVLSPVTSSKGWDSGVGDRTLEGAGFSTVVVEKINADMNEALR